MNSPLVSIIMSVYNEQSDFLKLALDSILNQTYENIEFVIVNDSPSNRIVSDILLEYERLNSNIVIITNKTNEGLAKSLNLAISNVSGSYIARMDSDDVSLPRRIEKQMQYLKNTKSDLVGSYIENIDENGNTFSVSKVPTSCKKLLKLLPYSTIAFHPTWFAKAEIFKEVKYNSLFSTAQDYDFLNRAITKGYIVSNIDEVLLQYRSSRTRVSSRNSFLQINFHYLINKKRVDENFDIDKSTKKLINNINVNEENTYIYANNLFIEFSKYKKITDGLQVLFYLFKSKMFRYKIKNFIFSKIIKLYL